MFKSNTEKLSLQEVLKEFLFDCKLRKLSERTMKSYKKMLSELRAGDTVIVKELTRVSRSTRDMLELVAQITEMGWK